MSREKLIEKYEQMMFDEGEFDIWEDEILPVLETLTTARIKKMYEQDKSWYQARKAWLQV